MILSDYYHPGFWQVGVRFLQRTEKNFKCHEYRILSQCETQKLSLFDFPFRPYVTHEGGPLNRDVNTFCQLASS